MKNKELHCFGKRPHSEPCAEQAPAGQPKTCDICRYTGIHDNACPVPAQERIALEAERDELRSQLEEAAELFVKKVRELIDTKAQLSTTREIARELAAAVELCQRTCHLRLDATEATQAALAKARAAGLLDAQRPAEGSAQGGTA